MEARVRLVSPLERALYLKKLGALQSLSSADIGLIARHVTEQFFKKGTMIFEKDRRLESFHVVVDGRIRVSGGEHSEGYIGPDQTLGFLSLVSRSEDGLEAVAETDVTTLEMSADDLDDVVEDHFSILLNQLRAIARNVLAERKKMPDGTYLAPAEGLVQGLPDRQLDLVERLLLMRRGAEFNNPNMDALIQIVKLSKEVGIPKDKTIWRPGDPSGHTYVIVNGTVRCGLPDGRHFRLGPGYPMGNIESLSMAPRWYEAVTETNVLAMRGETDAFLDVLEDHSEFAKEFVAIQAQGLIRIIAQRRQALAEEPAA